MEEDGGLGGILLQAPLQQALLENVVDVEEVVRVLPGVPQVHFRKVPVWWCGVHLVVT